MTQAYIFFVFSSFSFQKRRLIAPSKVDSSIKELKSNPVKVPSPTETTKKKEEEENIIRTNSEVIDCAISVVSSASIATHSSKKTPKVETASAEPTPSGDSNGDVIILSNSMPVSEVDSKNNTCVAGGTKVDETDDQSSDGWETVEPKGGRSRRLASSTSRGTEKQLNDTSSHNLPQSPNASRRNKGKAKSRQRTKNKCKDKDSHKDAHKDVPKRSTEILESGIKSRGSNTIKALMEERNKRPSAEIKNKVEAPKQVSAKSSIADQNTAQTIPESLSGVSTAPVQTLVGPGNNNSASSSVASSLEAPHATRHKPHHHHDSCKEDDVGYHLLKVCDRLSLDMNTFMRRRASALSVRRRERGVLLAALQDTVQVSICQIIRILPII